MLEEGIHVLKQWFCTLFTLIPFDKRLLFISPLIMSCAGCTGTLMVETKLVEVFNSTFGGFPKMLNRKRFPQNARGLKMLLGELLKPVFNESVIISVEELEKMLTKMSESSRTAKP